MDTMRRTAREYLSLGMVLGLVIAISVAVASCGGGDGDSDHGLCAQCGNDPDGPCLLSVTVDRDPSAPAPCNVPGDSICSVELDCFRKLGSAQRRCFPLVPKDPNNPNAPRFPQIQFECDGAGPNASTPFPTTTPTVTTSSTPMPTNTNAIPTITVTPSTGI